MHKSQDMCVIRCAKICVPIAIMFLHKFKIRTLIPWRFSVAHKSPEEESASVIALLLLLLKQLLMKLKRVEYYVHREKITINKLKKKQLAPYFCASFWTISTYIEQLLSE